MLLQSQLMARMNKDPPKQQLEEKFNNTCRYLDDILALHNDDFNTYTEAIYPVEMFLNKANIDNKLCSFLELSIHICNRKLNTKQ